MRLLSRCEPINGCGKTYPADLDKCPHCGTPEAFSVAAPLDPRDWGWDLETFPNVITASFIHAATGLEVVFEISDRRNQVAELIEFVLGLGRSKARGIGYNNLGFDYPIIHWLVANPNATAAQIYVQAMKILKASDADRFGMTIWESGHVFEQLDPMKICHFDNNNKRTSLKALEIVMRSRNVIDLPFPVGIPLRDDQIDELISYNKHDVRETLKFYVRILPEVHLREALSKRYETRMMNMSNTKIGATILIKEMEASGIVCFDRGPGGKYPRQTYRESINLGDVVFPYVKFERSEFNHVVEQFRSKTLRRTDMGEEIKTKGVFANIIATIDGFDYEFGLGGIHGSILSQIVTSDADYMIIDADVTSFYPKMAIVNRLYPAHLGEAYCDSYNGVFLQRATFAKGTPENAALKESLNASYGNSNNKFSPLFDPYYTMATTINGQLSLCMLAEQLVKIPNMTMIQCNTDGLTVRIPRSFEAHFYSVCKWWEGVTQLNLEYALYSRMIIRDVNSYIAEYEGGKLKRKGAYEYNTLWHQDPSAQVVARAAEAALVRGESVREFITNHRDPFDFMCRAKVPRSNSLHLRFKDWGIDQQLQGTTRYFVSRNGGTLVKVAPPTGEPGTWKRKAKLTDSNFNAVMREIAGQPGTLDSAGTPWDARIHTGNRSKHDTRETGICSGWRVTECADARHFDWSDLNYEWYIIEAEKLVNPLLTGSSC